ncbi:MAG: DUF2141 domain-containing protein [Pseudomonadota bacterium]
MSRKQTLRRAAVIALCLTGVLTRTAQAEEPRARVSEIRFASVVSRSGGQVVCALFREQGWLKRPVLTVKAPLRGREATCVFAGVDAGVYAIVAFHDENGNGSIDKNFLGIPTESWCTSRNASAVFGPPSFDSAKFLARGGVIRFKGSM